MGKSLAVIALLLGGCDLYFAGGDDEPPCAYGAAENGGAAPSQELRDPYTGECRPYGGSYPCDDVCGPCPAIGTDMPNWGSCYSACEGLDAYTCSATPGCFTAYLDPLTDDRAPEYWGCWQTAPSGPTPGSCENLDAQACSEHDNCAAHYVGAEQGYTKFAYCGPELDKQSCTNVDCGPGYHCEEQCYGDMNTPDGMSYCEATCVQDSSCALIDCGPGYTCAEVCTVDSNGVMRCSATCVPDQNDPGECYGQVICAMPPPACPTGTTPGVSNGCYTGYCIPTTSCSPNDPGECYGTVSCNRMPPACPSNSTPGVRNGCYTGYCIPTSQCPAAACETLTSESACVARMDCTPVYTGTNCTCYPNGGCECQTLTYDRCESW